MIRLSWATVLVVMLTTNTSTHAAESDTWFPEKLKDFGTVPRGPMLVHYFRVTNNTDQPIQIGGVRVSCGCVTATAPQPLILAGQSSAIYAQMDTRRFISSKTVTIYVTLIKPRFEEVALQVTAFAREDFMIHPDSIAFGQVARGQASKSTVRVSFYGDLNWQIQETSCDSPFVKASFKNVPGTNTNEVSYELTAELRPDIPPGKWFTDVWLKTSNATASKIRVPLTVEVVAGLTATPPMVQFGLLLQGQASEQKVLIKGAAPFKVLNVEGTDETLKLTSPMSEEAKAVHVLTFAVDAKNPGKLDRKIKIVTDMGKENEITILLSGEVLIKQ